MGSEMCIRDSIDHPCNRLSCQALTNMSTAARYLAAVTLFIAGCAAIDTPRESGAGFVKIAEAFRFCVGPYGVNEAVARFALKDGPDPRDLEHVELSTSGMISDGYNHTLFWNRSREVAYVAETGGFAGVRRWYGPFPLGTRCMS